jgi:hypothetical protein
VAGRIYQFSLTVIGELRASVDRWFAMKYQNDRRRTCHNITVTTINSTLIALGMNLSLRNKTRMPRVRARPYLLITEVKYMMDGEVNSIITFSFKNQAR